MNPADAHYARLLNELRDDYEALATGATGLGGFQRRLAEVLTWADIAAASRIRFRVNREPLSMPVPTIEAVTKANPWLESHLRESKPSIAARAKFIADAEKDFWESRGDTIERPYAVARFRFTMLYRCGIQDVTQIARQIEISDPQIQNGLPFAKYVSMCDNRTRPTHRSMDGLIAHVLWEGWSVIRPPNGYNSVVGNTQVSGQVVAASKASYSGPLIEIDTRSGLRLSITVNHPVLTSSGFVAACNIRKGHHLLTDRNGIESFKHTSGDDRTPSPSISGKTVNNEQKPSAIENVFESFSREGVMSILPSRTSLDFHGDSRFMYGDVHVVRPYRFLPSDIEPFSLQHCGDPSLIPMSDYSSPSPSYGSLIGGNFVCFGASSDLYSPLGESGSQSLTASLELLRQLEKRYPGRILRDEVVNVNVVSHWSGPVYDVQSPNGWIVANGLLISNCRCDVDFVPRETALKRGWFLKDGITPKFQVKWPNSASRRNYERGSFPDPGWSGPKVRAGDV